MAKFFRLLDKENYNVIIKTESDGAYRYYPLKGWKRTSLFTFGYTCEDSDTYDMYEEISADDAVAKYGLREEDAMDILNPKAQI